VKERKNTMVPKGRKQKSQLREWTEAIILAFIIAMLIRTFIVQAFKIPSSSMEPTLEVGDHILVSKFIYGIKIPFVEGKVFLRTPDRGDIIVFVYPRDKTKDFIKRVIGLPGEKIQIIGKQILVNDEPIEDPWGHYTRSHVNSGFVKDNYGPKIVPPNSLFVMGDNRDNSQDSRYWGFVDLNAVKGEAFIIYFSWDKTSRNLLKKIRWSRIGHLIR
jgi:signal peptidase I